MAGISEDAEEIWEADDSEMTTDEIDGSISVNTLSIRRKLNESLQQSLTESPLESMRSPGEFERFIVLSLYLDALYYS